MSVVRKLLKLILLLNCIVYKICGLGETELRNDILHIRYNISFPIPSMLLTEPITSRDIKYYIYNADHENVTIGRNFNYINRKYPIKVLIHGWTEHTYVEWYKNAISAYMRRGLNNVIAVDWSSKGDTDYVTASRNAKPIGDRIGEFLVKLHDRIGIPYKNMHIISYSLGCHVAGFVGKRVFEITQRKIARITGLDPAAPIFDLFAFGSNARLSKGDANFVDITHTDGGMLGFNYPIGTADFFPNGGVAIQPGCSLIKVDIKYGDFFCSHASSHQLFINSINSGRLTAKNCESWEKYTKGMCSNSSSIVFGEDVPETATGNFYFETKDNDTIIKH